MKTILQEGQQQVLNVHADAEIKVKPNRVSITVGLNQRSRDLRSGKDKIHRFMHMALAFCKHHGVKDEFLQTSYIQIDPVYNRDDRDSISDDEAVAVWYYAFEQSLTVVLTDVSKLETIVYGLLDLGMNTVENIRFETTEFKKYKNEARLIAINEAQEKARRLTEAVGLKLGKPINIREDGDGCDEDMVMTYSRNMSRGVVCTDSAPAPAMAVGMISVESHIDISYLLE